MNTNRNPVAARLTPRGTWPSARVALWLALGLGLAGLAISTLETLRMRSEELGSFSVILLLMGLLVTILTPPIVAGVAVVLTSRDLHSGTYELMHVTTLSETTLVQGYVFAALHRVRFLLALVVGLMPALAVGMVQVGIAVAVIFYSIMVHPDPGYQYGPYGTSPGLDPAHITGPALACMAIVVGLWGLNWQAAALGVGLSLRWRGSIMAIIAAPMITLLIAIGLPVLVLLTNGMGMVVAATLLAPYILGAVTTALARRWAGA